MSQRLPRTHRICDGSEIRKILQQGQKHQGAYFSLFCLSEPSSSKPLLRAGFLSPKRMGKAVQRNRFRRQMKEIFRKQRANLTGASQILIMGRFSAVKADSSMLADDFLKLCRRARLLMESPPPLRE